LRLELLPAGEIRRLVQARLGVEAAPKALVQLVTEKAEGNALFAEEILSFLTERGVLRAEGGNAEFDAGAVGAALPASVQSFAYFAMAGAKSLLAYSFDEAGNHFAAAIALLDEHPHCAGEQ
jgi:hypothetical protein